MDNEDEELNLDVEESSTLTRVLPIVVLSVLALLVGMSVYMFLELRSARSETAEALQQLKQHEEQIAQLEGTVNRASRSVDEGIKELQGAMAGAEKGIAKAARDVEQRVLGRTNTLAKQLEEEKKQRNAKLSEVGGELAKLSEVTGNTDNRLGSLSGEVDTVKDEVEKTKAALQQAINDLKTVRGDMGVQSGLIATNAGELQVLRELGERNYYEFDLTKSKQPQRIGSIQMRLRKTDRKRNRYTLDIWADDKRIEKKNKTLLEPVQFYVIGSKLPYEIVVNKIDKNRVVGYLATPKAKPRRTVASASGG
jgi:DNA repair exonuclease SbcCD ATPase subunit